MKPRPKYRDNIPARERVIVTVKPNPHDGDGGATYKIIGPNRSSIEIRRNCGLGDRYLAPFREGAKEIKAYAVLGRNGRYQLVDLVARAGLEPATPAL